MKRTSALLLVAVAAACGGGARDGAAGAPQGGSSPTPDAAHLCTGPVPSNAMACPGADQGLTADAGRVVVGACGAVPCSYACIPGYIVSAGACAASPSARGTVLTDGGDGTVLDRARGLAWLKRATCTDTVGGTPRTEGGLDFRDATRWVGELAAGACGLSDGSRPGDWRLPDVSELLTLAGAADPARLFTGQVATAYWSSFEPCTSAAFAVDVRSGTTEQYAKELQLGVWPVRASSP